MYLTMLSSFLLPLLKYWIKWGEGCILYSRKKIILWYLKRSNEESVQFTFSVMSYSLRHYELTAAHQASLSITNFWSLHKFMSTESMMPSNHLILCPPLLLPPLLLPPSIFPSIRVFSNESVLCIRWPKYWRLGSNF